MDYQEFLARQERKRIESWEYRLTHIFFMFLFFAFAVYGFYTFMDKISSCEAKYQCFHTVSPDEADQQW